MLTRLLIGTALSGLLVPVLAQAESAALGATPASSGLQHPNQLAPSASSQYLPFQPRISVNGALGSDRSLAVTEGWAPLWQDDFNVFYGDIRAMVDDGNNEEYNLGFGYRALRGSQIGGLHAWLDKRDTSLGSTFYQATIGAELLTYDTDLRFNMYIPITGTKHHTTPNVGSSTPYLAGSGIFYDTTGILAEEPQKGLDLEAGYRLPIMQAYVDAFRVYGGGYAFLGNESDDVVGLRTRAQIDVNPWLSIGARVQRDDERGTQGFLEATLRFPVTSKKMIQREGVRARMDESPERDVDIVTGAKQVDTGLAKPVVNTETGQAQRVLYVDNSKAAGDGTKENPYNTLKTAEAALQAGDILYVFAGDGTETNQDKGIVINKDNVSLIGSGVNFIFDAGKFQASGAGADFSGSLLMAAGAAPVISNNDVPLDALDIYVGNGVLVTADNASISGITVKGAKSVGIRALADNAYIANFTAQNVSVMNNLGHGALVQAINGGRIENANFSHNMVDGNTNGFAALNSGGNNVSGGSMGHLVITHNTVKNSSNTGISIAAAGATSYIGTSIDSVLIEQNQLSMNTSSGIALASGRATIKEARVVNNTITDSSRGFSIASGANGTIQSLDIIGNSMLTSGQTGIYISTTGLLIENMRVGNNQVLDSGQNGISLIASGGGSISNVELFDNMVKGSQQNGVLLQTSGGSNMTISVSGNTITENGSGASHSGIYLNQAAGTLLNANLGDGATAGSNRIFNNFATSKDIRLNMVSGATVKAENNWWGVNTGLAAGRVTLGAGNSLDSSPYLTVDPGI